MTLKKRTMLLKVETTPGTDVPKGRRHQLKVIRPIAMLPFPPTNSLLVDLTLDCPCCKRTIYGSISLPLDLIQPNATGARRKVRQRRKS